MAKRTRSANPPKEATELTAPPDLESALFKGWTPENFAFHFTPYIRMATEENARGYCELAVRCAIREFACPKPPVEAPAMICGEIMGMVNGEPFACNDSSGHEGNHSFTQVVPSPVEATAPSQPTDATQQWCECPSPYEGARPFPSPRYCERCHRNIFEPSQPTADIGGSDAFHDWPQAAQPVASPTPEEWLVREALYPTKFSRRNGQLIDEYTAAAVMSAYAIEYAASQSKAAEARLAAQKNIIATLGEGKAAAEQCAEKAEARVRVAEMYETAAYNLLAVIFRDGGHEADMRGFVGACSDAEAIVNTLTASLRDVQETRAYAIKELADMIDDNPPNKYRLMALLTRLSKEQQ